MFDRWLARSIADLNESAKAYKERSKATFLRRYKDASVYVVNCPKERRHMRRWRHHAYAIGEYIFVRTKTDATIGTLEHEYTHVLQARANPLYYWSYVVLNIVGLYWFNPYEISARRAERRITQE